MPLVEDVSGFAADFRLTKRRSLTEVPTKLNWPR